MTNNNMDKRFFHALAGEIMGENLTLYSIDYNVMMHLNLLTNQIVFEKGFNEYRIDSRYNFSNAISWNDNVYLIPCQKADLGKINMKTKEKKLIPIERNEKNNYSPFLKNNKLFLMPIHLIDEILEVSLDDDTIYYHRFYLPEEISEKRVGKQPVWGIGDSIESKIYRGCRFLPIIQIYDTKSGDVNYIKAPQCEQGIRDLVVDENYIWILNHNIFIKWNYRTHNLEYSLYLDKETGNTEYEGNICWLISGVIYITATNNANIIEIDVNTDEMEIIDCYEKIPGFHILSTNTKSNFQPFSHKLCQDKTGNVYFLPFHANGIVKRNIVGEYSLIPLFFETDRLLELFDADDVINENMCSIQKFEERIFSNKNKQKRSSIGNEVLKELLIVNSENRYGRK